MDRSVRASRSARRRVLFAAPLLLLASCGFDARASSLQEPPSWTKLAEGLSLARTSVRPVEGETASPLVLLRLDPSRWRLEPHHFADEELDGPLSLEDWLERTGAPIVFNAGFYYEDFRHIGLLLRGDRNLGTSLHPKWKGLLVSDPRQKGAAGIDILDLLGTDFSEDRPSHDVVVQSLMILRDGEKRVGRSDRIASRTAVARDRTGRIYIVWAQGPFSLWRLADILDHTGLDIDRAMTMDGGGEAQLAVHAGETDLRVYGVTGLGLLQGPVPLPAIVAVRPRKATE